MIEMAATFICEDCGKEVKDKNVLGLNKKLRGTWNPKMYCFDCLSAVMGISKARLLQAIQAYKAQGCQLFE